MPMRQGEENFVKARHLSSIAIILGLAVAAAAQTTSFVYQGKLQDGGIAANGTYQFEFRLFSAASGGNQIGPTISNLPATVTNGIFAVNLDFGGNSFSDGAARYLEIGVRLNGSGQPYTLLTPRQAVTSTPFAVRSIFAGLAISSVDSQNLGGIPAAQYVVTTDPRMSDSRNPLPNSPNYIQNTQSPQAASNFNISGTGKAGIIDVVTQYNIGGARILSAGGSENIFAGFNSGNTTSGGFNAFFGSNSGKVNTTGASNSFFGSYAGSSNTVGSSNSFFGVNSGGTNTEGGSNSFFGAATGFSNTTGANNSYFGVSAGQSNQLAANNSMFGYWAGKQNTAGGNSFIGAFSGEKNTTGTFNSYFGFRAGKDTFTGSYNVYIGYETGAGNGSGSNNTYVGGATNGTGSNNTFVGYSIAGGNGSGNSAFGYNASINNGISNATAIGTGAIADESNAIVLGDNSTKVKVPGGGIWSFGSITTPSTVQASFLKGNSLTVLYGGTFGGTIHTGGVVSSGDISGNSGYFDGTLTGYYLGTKNLAPNGTQSLCIQDPNPNFNERFLSVCSSSRRYKENIEDFRGGLEMIRRLRPVTFDWKSSGTRDIGFIAEEINEVEPLLNNYLDGRVEGVKYDRVTTLLVNAVKEQQDQIESLSETVRRQDEQIRLLKQLVCTQNPGAAVCTGK